MKNYYEEILESLGKQVSELLDKLEKETDWVKRKKFMNEFDVLAKHYLELSKAWQNISERREEMAIIAECTNSGSFDAGN